MRGDIVRAYLEQRAVHGSWSLELTRSGLFPGGIVIPVLAEADTLLILLESLSSDSSLPASGLLVVFVINNREDAGSDVKSDNARSLALLRDISPRLPFPVGIIDASTPGFSLPDKGGGVGLARKLGHDLLLPSLDFSGVDPVIISLDADTQVSQGYAGAIMDHFRYSKAGGAVIPFTHQSATGERENQAIERYELFLRCYVAGLAHAGSPYAFHTVGSAMACRASAYLKCGGMNKRQAGEDFYFLQSLAKTSGVEQVEGAMVFPSPRRSWRVPFGTGRSVGMLLDGDPEAVLFYRPECYLLLQKWLSVAEAGCMNRSDDLMEQAGRLSSYLHSFLMDQNFPKTWSGLLSHNPGQDRLSRAFHNWFDAFRTMKLFHYLSDSSLPRTQPEQIVNTWPDAWGKAELLLHERLEYLRRVQGAIQV